jgi:hypothetical protein
MTSNRSIPAAVQTSRLSGSARPRHRDETVAANVKQACPEHVAALLVLVEAGL